MRFLFDYDDVIADSFDALLEVCAEAQAAFRKGRTPTPNDFRTIENLTFNELGRMIGIPEEQCPAYGAKVFEIQQKTGRACPLPEVVEVIQALALQHTIAVVTNSHDHVVSAALADCGLGAFATAVAGGESKATKVDRIVKLQTAYAGVDGTTCMIGDTIGDIRAGKQAGVKTAAVTCGFQARDLLARESPDYLVDHPKEILAIAYDAEQRDRIG